MAQVAHFAINADDLERARGFYTNVFGWKFEAWGPPGFYMIEAADTLEVPLRASLQKRRELIPGTRMTGFECTISVPEITAAAKAIEANGGRIVMPICTLAGIGRLLFFQDPEGNLAGAMEYDRNAE
jgi:predicted enzyme related to lactoylglutathione lyase